MRTFFENPFIIPNRFYHTYSILSDGKRLLI